MDAVRLAQVFRGTVDLATAFATSAAGDEVVDAGIAIPMTVEQDGNYSVTMQTNAEHGAEGPNRCWALYLSTGEVTLARMGDLYHWDAQSARHRRLRLPAGWYVMNATVSGVPLLGDTDDGDDFQLTITLTPSQSRPDCHGPLDAQLSPDRTRRTPGMLSIWTASGVPDDEVANAVKRDYPPHAAASNRFSVESGIGWYDETNTDLIFAPDVPSLIKKAPHDISVTDALGTVLRAQPCVGAFYVIYDCDAADMLATWNLHLCRHLPVPPRPGVSILKMASKMN